jgi:hypothetical protein
MSKMDKGDPSSYAEAQRSGEGGVDLAKFAL